MKSDNNISNSISISIIVPVFNVENYIERCLNSIINQVGVETFECILVDDCGNDRSISIAEEIVKCYKGQIVFKIIHHNKNMGLSAARNSGIRAALGEYVYFLDSDDEIMPETIKHFREIIYKYPNVDVVQGDALSTGERENRWISLKGKDLPSYSDDENWLCKAFLENIPMTAWNKIIKKDLFARYPKLFFMEGVIHEDIYLDFYLAKYATSFAKCDYKSYKYYVNPNTIMTSSSASKECESYKRLLSDFTSNYTNQGLKAQRGFVIGLLLIAYDLFALKHKSQFKSLVNSFKKKCNYKEKILISCWLLTPLNFSKNKSIQRVIRSVYVRLG